MNAILAVEKVMDLMHAVHVVDQVRSSKGCKGDPYVPKARPYGTQSLQKRYHPPCKASLKSEDYLYLKIIV